MDFNGTLVFLDFFLIDHGGKEGAAEDVQMDVIRIARIEGKDQKLLGRLNKMDVLIIDDFGMKPINEQQQNDFEQILDVRYKRKAIIISSQLPVSDWHALFRNGLIADACMDRISHKSIRFQLLGESLRKKY